MISPRKAYVEYVSSLAESDDLDALQSYEEWLEDELTEAWEQHGNPYL